MIYDIYYISKIKKFINNIKDNIFSIFTNFIYVSYLNILKIGKFISDVYTTFMLYVVHCSSM